MALFLSEADIGALATMPIALAAVHDVMAELGRGLAVNMPRERLRGRLATLHLMQGQVPSQNAIGYKSYTASGGVARFLVHLYDMRDGRLEAVVEAGKLGALRTGAASGVATRLLANPDAAVLGVLGSGRQAAEQIDAVRTVRNLRDIKVYSRRGDRLAAFCAALTERIGQPVRAVGSAEEAVRGSDIVTTITPSETPVLDAAWLQPGVHINAAGSNQLSRREIGGDTLARCALIVVDSIDVARKEAGDLLPLVEQGRLQWSGLTELGALACGRAGGRGSPADITCFESFGLAVQDVMLASRLLALARERGLGTPLPFGG